MLSKNKGAEHTERAAKVETLIGRNTHFFGNIQFSGGLLVEGKVTGNIETQNGEQATLILSKDGVVEGDIKVPNVVVHGRIKGNLYSRDRVELGKTAYVEGDLHYKLVEMAMGAEVNGALLRNPDGQVKQEPVSDAKTEAQKDPASTSKKSEKIAQGI